MMVISKTIFSIIFFFSVSCFVSGMSNAPSSLIEKLSFSVDGVVEETDPSSTPWAPVEMSTDSNVSTPDDFQTITPEETTVTQSKSCLTLESAGCVDMYTLDIGKVMVGLTAVEERTVASCVNLCSEKRPGTSVVYAVWITTNDPQRLFCGCDYSLSGRLVSEALCSVRCPGDGRRCGALVNKVFSVYILTGDVEAVGDRNPIVCNTEAPIVSTTDSAVTTTPLPTLSPPFFSTASPTRPSPTLPPASDFEFLGCFKEATLSYDDMMYIEHVDHRYRSVSSCFRVCQNLHKSTTAVYTKMIEMNERLVCGCDTRSKDLIPVGTRVESSFCDEGCPDGGGSCGSLKRTVVSAYREAATSGPVTPGPVPSGEATYGRSEWVFLGALVVMVFRLGP